MRRRIEAIAGAFAIACLFAFSTSAAHAQTAASTTAVVAPAISPAASPIFGLMQGLFGLAVVIALIFAAGWMLKKIGPRARTNSVVQVIGGASVGPREKVVVIRFGTQTLLLGVAPGHVGLLHTADASELVDAETPAASAPKTPRFIDRLRAARGNS